MNNNPYEGLATAFGGRNEERQRRRRKHNAGATAGWQFAGSSFDLDFANGRYFGGNLTDLLTISRASSGYAANVDGTLTNFPSNTLRVGVGTGLLVEESRTNQVFHSQDWTIGWSVQATTITSAAAVAPDGTTTAVKVLAVASNSIHAPYQNQNGAGQGASPDTYQSITVYAKAGTNNYAYINFGVGAPTTNWVTQVYDLANGVIGESAVGAGSGTKLSASIDALANGWYRLTLVCKCTYPLSTDTYLEYGLASAATGNSIGATYGEIQFNAAGTEYVYFWGAQIERDVSFPTSYIPTIGGVATRAADVVSLIGLADTTIRHAGASHFVSMAAMPLTTNRYILGSDHGSVGMAIPGTGSAGTDVIIYDGTLVLHATPGSGLTPASPLKTALGWNAAGRSIVSANGTVVTNANAQVIDPSAYYLGSDNTSGFVDTYILRVALWNSRLADVALKGLTV
jgi:hypothetical protein